MRFIAFLLLIPLVACNSVYIKPDTTMQKDTVVYIDRGGFSMKRSIKQEFEKRGYRVVVGKAKSSIDFNNSEEDIKISTSYVPENTKYVIEVRERSEKLAPVWCVFNGFWWWNFNVSIADQDTGEELLSWAGRGCKNSSLRKLNTILDKMESNKNG